MPEYQDQTLHCKDCGTDFVFSAQEQAFYAEKGLRNAPSRCKPCRDKHKQNMSSRRGRGGMGGGRHERAPRSLFQVTCAACGVQTEVPFEPVSGKPVYCRDCFQKFKAQR